MPIYMVQASYAPQAVASMVTTPQDRATAIKPMIESMGGKLQDLWFCFGEYDIVAIADPHAMREAQNPVVTASTARRA